MVNSVSGMSGIDPGMMQQMREKMFTKMDTNGDGAIDKTELQAMADEHSKRSGAAMDVEEIFAADDTNNDGVIDQTEFTESSYRPEGMPPGPPPQMSMTSSEAGNYTIQSLLDMLNNSEKTDSVDLFA